MVEIYETLLPPDSEGIYLVNNMIATIDVEKQ